MKVLIYDPISRTGGGLAYIKNALPFLSDTPDVHFILYCNRSIKKNIESIKTDATIIYSPIGSERGGLKAFIQRRKTAKAEILALHPDVIIFMNQIPAKLPVFSILFLRNALYFIKKGINYSGPFSFYDKLRCSVLRLITWKSICRSDMIMTSSESFANQLKKIYGKKNSFIINPFGTNKVTECFISGDKFINKPVRLLALQYNFYKGIETVVDAAFYLLKEKYPVSLTITDDLQIHSDKRARKLGKKIRLNNALATITCTGKLTQEELADVYRETDIFIFSSFVESFGHGILEAMNNRIPVLLSDIPVFKEIAGDAAIYFKVGDAKDLAAKIQLMLSDVALVKNKIEKGCKIAQTYTWQSHVSRLIETVKQSTRTSNT